MIETGTLVAIMGTALGSMAINSFASALPHPGTFVRITFLKFCEIFYKFMYDWFIGFMSLKEGRPIGSIVANTTGVVQETTTFHGNTK